MQKKQKLNTKIRLNDKTFRDLGSGFGMIEYVRKENL